MAGNKDRGGGIPKKKIPRDCKGMPGMVADF